MLRWLLICVLPFVFGTTTVQAQWQWGDNSVGTAGFERVYDVAVDDVRNAIYSVGCIDGVPNFPEISNTSLGGGKDGFVMKYDTAGVVVWAFAVGGTNNDCISAVDVDTTTGNIFVTGSIVGNMVDLSGTGGGVPGSVSGVNGQDGFVASYNDLGQLLWFDLIGGSGFDGGIDLTVNEGGVYVHGYYANTGLLSSLLSVVLPIGGELNNFVMAFDKSNGNFLWDAIMTSSSDDYYVPSNNDEISRMGITSDANNIYLVSQKGGDNYRIRDASGGVATTISNPDKDFVVTSYTNGGVHNWSVLYDNNGTEVYGLDITNDCSGVYVTGTMHNGGVTPGGTVIYSMHDDFILSKLNKSNGNELWVKEFNSLYEHDDYFVGLDADGYGNLYAVGRLRGTATSLNSEFTYVSGPPYSEVMIAHFYTDGAFQSFETYSSSDDSWAMSVGTYKNEKYVVGGYYSGNLSFDGMVVSNAGTDNAFIAARNLQPPISFVSESGNSVFCQDEPNPTPIMNAIAGGTFSGPPEVVFASTSTGKIDLSSSTPGGPYTITYTIGSLNCSAQPYTAQIEIVAVDDPSFSYANTNMCVNEPNQLPSSITSPGGTFLTSSAVVVDAITGEINAAASPIGGPYYIVYTTDNALCPRQDSIAIYIKSTPNPSFTYAQSTFCEGGSNVWPNFVAEPGGTFSCSSGIVFANASTGEIDLSASTAGGPYTIQYLVSNTYCEDSTTFVVTILPYEDPSFTYVTDHFCVNETNPSAASTVYSGGVFSSPTGLIIANASTGEIDVMTSPLGAHDLVYTTSTSMCAQSDTVEVFVEAAPDPTFSYAQASYCEQTGTVTPASITTSGGVFSAPPEIVFVNTTTGEIDLNASTPGGPYAIQYWVSNAYCEDSTTFSLTILSEDDPSFSYGGNHFCNNEPNVVPVTVATSGGTFTASAGLTVASASGEIDVTNSVLGGPYFVYYTTSGSACPSTDSVEVYIESAPDPSFGYAQSSYCITEGLISTDFITTPGGTFSAPPEITFGNSAIGEIDLTSSTPGGPYSIQYLVSNAYCQKSTTVAITIIDQDELTSVDYNSSAFCISDDNQLPIIYGLTGGSFSSEASLELVDVTTGEISPSSSIPGGPYEMKYVTPGTCPDSVEWQISINDELTAYAGEDQQLYFSTKSSLDADDPLAGMGEWGASSSAIITDVMDSKSDVTNLSVGNNVFTWTVSDGVCPSVSDDIIIHVEDLFIPQAITPNEDGKNDYFELRSLDDVICDLKIFNRWGQAVYENSDYQNEWYGQNQNGDQLENDTYFYVVLIDDYLEYKGYVVLKK
ncbi:MAG: hypothetical protein CSA03_03900 [Bacteroidetes bacterium]|nr:MAG: hypothetical protein CSA03_03900 [Bacteroidota bacterium]